MKIKTHLFLAASLLMPALCLTPALRADDAAPVGGIAPKALFDPTDKSAATLFTASNGAESQVSVAPPATGSGVNVTIQPGEAGYPGVLLKPQGATVWDLSPYGDIQAVITNTSAKNVGLGLRVDNEGDWHESPWSAENVSFKPGETKTIKVIFGYSFNFKKSYPLKSNAINEVLLMVTNKVSGEPLIIHIDSIEASGSAGEKPPVDPNSVRIVPPNGFLVGPGVTIDAAKQLSGKGGATGSVADPASGSLKFDFPAGKGEESVTLKPAMGKWDLREALEIRVKVRNDGQTAVTPSALSTSGGGPTDTVAAASPIAPGAEAEIVIPFINPKVWENTPPSLNANPGTGNKYTNNAGATVTVSVPGADAAQSLTVESIKADAPPYSAPDWLGQKPPVDGEWTKTFDDEFDGTAIDETKWNTMADNYWDSRTHFTKEETTVSGGMATLRYEKKTGFQADDPTKKQTDYAAGYLDTYGKWVQRYGYFESRFKLPKAPGLWPAFWLMPDRGIAAGPEQWKRANTGTDTKTGTKGMEFDICEYLSGWGPYRYNIAMHWDGYGKDHKWTGQVTNYAVTDKDGFLTCGLLWLPGKAIFYCNGKEMLHYENDRVSDAPSNIIFNYVSGGWDNLPLEDDKLPADLVIDYVRVWQRKDLASSVDGPQTPPAPAPAVTPASTNAPAPAPAK